MAPIVSCMVTRIGPKLPPKLFIAEWREHRHLTQQQLADRIDSTKGTISRWENGERDVTVNALAALADALDCEVTDLYRSPDRPSADDLLRDLDDRARAQAIRVIQALRTGTG
jgi:transcriptional regulator with XRE-family HTH domain